MSCAHHRVVVDHWSPATDLPEGTALHLDDCASCRARFDDRFTPVTVHRPVEARRSVPVHWIALAAAGLLWVGLAPVPARDGGMSEASVAADLGECPDEIWFEPTCPA
ncbi:MAG: hypothetical protein R3F61_22905 [Myxococcota bacterium]